MSKKVLAVAGVIAAVLIAATTFDPAHAPFYTAIAACVHTFIDPKTPTTGA